MIATTTSCMVARMKTIGFRIAAARERKGLNQSELGRLLGVTPQSVQAWESDKNTPRPQRLSEIAAALGTSVSALVDGDEFLTDAGNQGSPSTKFISKDAPGESRLKVGEILIHQYELDVNHGKMPADCVDLVSSITVNGHQLERLGHEYTASANLSVVTAWGQSMEGTINDKDLVLVDRSVTGFVGDGVYLITWAGHLFIKRLQLAGADQLELISDNPTHKGRVVPKDEVTVHAKALLVWNAKKL
ncbi:transcriptional regulator, y4mF family [compost metagenome]